MICPQVSSIAAQYGVANNFPLSSHLFDAFVPGVDKKHALNRDTMLNLNHVMQNQTRRPQHWMKGLSEKDTEYDRVPDNSSAASPPL